MELRVPMVHLRAVHKSWRLFLGRLTPRPAVLAARLTRPASFAAHPSCAAKASRLRDCVRFSFFLPHPTQGGKRQRYGMASPSDTVLLVYVLLLTAVPLIFWHIKVREQERSSVRARAGASYSSFTRTRAGLSDRALLWP
jgi:hypothetical protein